MVIKTYHNGSRATVTIYGYLKDRLFQTRPRKVTSTITRACPTPETQRRRRSWMGCATPQAPTTLRTDPPLNPAAADEVCNCESHPGPNPIPIPGPEPGGYSVRRMQDSPARTVQAPGGQWKLRERWKRRRKFPTLIVSFRIQLCSKGNEGKEGFEKEEKDGRGKGSYNQGVCNSRGGIEG